LNEGVLQHTRGVGTVTIVQPVPGDEGKPSKRWFALTNIPQPDEVYELIRSLSVKKSGA
jgi:hypothetical protein